jgi:hypothetical protein
MNPLEILALILAIAVFIKLVTVLAAPKSWLNFIKSIYKRPNLLLGIELILTTIVLYYLTQYLSVIQIIGGVILGALLTGMTITTYSKELLPSFIKIFKKGNMFKRAWLPMLIWLALIIWILQALFS